MWKQKGKDQCCAQDLIKPKAVRRTLGIVKPTFTSTLSSSPASLGNKEIRIQQIEIEQKRLIAIEYARRNALR